MKHLIRLLVGLGIGFVVIIAAAGAPFFEYVFVAAAAAMLAYALFVAFMMEREEGTTQEQGAKKAPMLTKTVKAGLGIVLPLDKVLIVNYDPPFVFIPLEYIIDYLDSVSPPPAPKKEEERKKKREEVIDSVIEALSRK